MGGIAARFRTSHQGLGHSRAALAWRLSRGVATLLPAASRECPRALGAADSWVRRGWSSPVVPDRRGRSIGPPQSRRPRTGLRGRCARFRGRLRAAVAVGAGRCGRAQAELGEARHHDAEESPRRPRPLCRPNTTPRSVPTRGRRGGVGAVRNSGETPPRWGSPMPAGPARAGLAIVMDRARQTSAMAPIAAFRPASHPSRFGRQRIWPALRGSTTGPPA